MILNKDETQVLKEIDPLLLQSWDEAVMLNRVLLEPYRDMPLSQTVLASLGAASFQSTVATFDAILKHKRAQP